MIVNLLRVLQYLDDIQQVNLVISSVLLLGFVCKYSST